MKALSVKQPWASLIVEGHKDIENRSWRTNYRGILVIHAGAQVDAPAQALHGDLLTAEPLGAIIGTVRVIDCVRDSESPWAIAGQWHWVLADPRPCHPRPVKGSLGLWSLGNTEWAWVRRTRVSRRLAEQSGDVLV